MRWYLLTFITYLIFTGCTNSNSSGAIVDGEAFGFRVGVMKQNLVNSENYNAYLNVTHASNVNNTEKRCFGSMKEKFEEVIILHKSTNPRGTVCLGLNEDVLQKVSWRMSSFDP